MLKNVLSGISLLLLLAVSLYVSGCSNAPEEPAASKAKAEVSRTGKKD